MYSTSRQVSVVCWYNGSQECLILVKLQQHTGNSRGDRCPMGGARRTMKRWSQLSFRADASCPYPRENSYPAVRNDGPGGALATYCTFLTFWENSWYCGSKLPKNPTLIPKRRQPVKTVTAGTREKAVAPENCSSGFQLHTCTAKAATSQVNDIECLLLVSK